MYIITYAIEIIVFILVPGFLVLEHIKARPFLTVAALLVGLGVAASAYKVIHEKILENVVVVFDFDNRMQVYENNLDVLRVESEQALIDHEETKKSLVEIKKERENLKDLRDELIAISSDNKKQLTDQKKLEAEIAAEKARTRDLQKEILYLQEINRRNEKADRAPKTRGDPASKNIDSDPPKHRKYVDSISDDNVDNRDRVTVIW